MTCFPGKVLYDGECKSLLKQTHSLRYMMSYISTGTINGHAFPPGFIKNYKEEVKINLEEYLGTEIFELGKLYLVCNISCEKK